MKKWTFIVLIVLTTFLMGSSFAVGKIGLTYASPLYLVALRFIVAGVVMLIVVILLQRPRPTGKRNWLKIGVIGALQTAGVMGCIFISLRTITASESSILTFTNPLLVVVLGTIFSGIRYKWYQWVGVLLGVIGVSITVGAQVEWKIGIVWGLCSAIFWATATLLVKKWGVLFDTWVLSAYQMLCGGIILLLLSLTLEQPFFIWNHESILILLWLSIFSSIIQFAVWYYVLQHGDPGKTSSFLFLAPFFGVLSGWLLLGETLYLSSIVGGLCIIVGIYLVNRQFQSKKKSIST
ncbi:DMT family transporter [Paenibacillus sp. KACC 21273]|uniref:DMT family transporter n=1 Tax=Paenibacillus sp. KACC 21273 TaxID=3025665 RepID=UPI0023655C2D|nr:DMT family transporter [Paenibacillus sp. KACC 21273]WDF51345.1 DMT family transporter [Paenibacillus sp. KACC 21273]